MTCTLFTPPNLPEQVRISRQHMFALKSCRAPPARRCEHVVHAVRRACRRTGRRGVSGVGSCSDRGYVIRGDVRDPGRGRLGILVVSAVIDANGKFLTLGSVCAGVDNLLSAYGCASMRLIAAIGESGCDF